MMIIGGGWLQIIGRGEMMNFDGKEYAENRIVLFL